MKCLGGLLCLSVLLACAQSAGAMEETRPEGRSPFFEQSLYDAAQEQNDTEDLLLYGLEDSPSSLNNLDSVESGIIDQFDAAFEDNSSTERALDFIADNNSLFGQMLVPSTPVARPNNTFLYNINAGLAFLYNSADIDAQA